jgi:hypothetical protein
MSAADLETALRAAGMRCSIEAIDRLAVITADDAEAELTTVRSRREALRLARAHGFTHLALEVPGDWTDGAPLHRN